jgi:hypothetical protein
MSTARYQGKPLLRLLECYVLKAIDELSPSNEEKLVAMQPKLSQVYEVDGAWDHIVATTMEFPDAMPALIRETWRANQDRHRQPSQSKRSAVRRNVRR